MKPFDELSAKANSIYHNHEFLFWFAAIVGPSIISSFTKIDLPLPKSIPLWLAVFFLLIFVTSLYFNYTSFRKSKTNPTRLDYAQKDILRLFEDSNDFSYKAEDVLDPSLIKYSPFIINQSLTDLLDLGLIKPLGLYHYRLTSNGFKALASILKEDLRKKEEDDFLASQG